MRICESKTKATDWPCVGKDGEPLKEYINGDGNRVWFCRSCVKGYHDPRYSNFAGGPLDK